MNPHYTIRGVLRLTAPLHIAAPRKEAVDPDTDRLLPSGEKGIMVVPATKYRLPMFVGGSLAAARDSLADEGALRGSAFSDVPVIPANDLRGRLRRCAARRVFDVLLSNHEQISLEAYHGMTCGAVTGSPGGRLTFAEAAQATKHPFLGLFGGGPKMVRSSLQVSTGWPILASTIQAGVVSEDLQAEVPCPVGSEWLLTQRLFFRRIDDAIQFTDGHAQKVVRDFGPEVTRWIESVSAVKKARSSADNKAVRGKPRRPGPELLPVAEDGGSGQKATAAAAEPPSRLQLQGYNCIEFVIPGTRFYLEFSVEQAQAANGGLGLFLHALRDFTIQQNLGGWTKNGFGRFELGQLTIRSSEGGTLEQSVFAPSIAKAEFNDQSPLVLEALDQWASASADLRAAEIEKLYELTEG